MSHKATNWAIAQRGLKPATKLVLWHLCDRHHPDHGCFPSQETLAYDCEMSRSSVNLHLKKLEDLVLVKRVQRTDKKLRRKKSTLYILGFELPNSGQNGDGNQQPKPQKPCPNFGHGAVSEKTPKPCPKKRQSHVRNSDINLVKEPVKKHAPEASSDDLTPIALFWIDKIENSDSGKPAGSEAISPDTKRLIIASNLLTEQQITKAGLYR